MIQHHHVETELFDPQSREQPHWTRAYDHDINIFGRGTRIGHDGIIRSK
jgi:hypothetical protein